MWHDWNLTPDIERALEDYDPDTALMPRWILESMLADSRRADVAARRLCATTPTTETREDSRPDDSGAKPPSRGSVMRSAGESES